MLILSLFTLFIILQITNAFTSPAVTPTPTASSPAILLPRAITSAAISTSSTSAIDFISTEQIVVGPHSETINIAIPTCIQTIVPDKNGYVPPGTCNALWDYYPSFGAAMLFAILFGALSITHIWQAATYKKGFCWVVIMGALWETLAFTFRTISTRFQQQTSIYLIFQIFILLAPLWINAFDYMVLGRMIHFYLPSHNLFSIPASTLALAFVTLDFISFIIQLIGGSWAGPTAPASRQLQGIHIYMGGIGLQQFFILVFVGLAMKFQREMSATERSGGAGGVVKKGWRKLLYTLYATLGLITLRILFRLVEFSTGTTSSNPLPFHEAYFYILEAVPMFFAVLAFNIIHPGAFLVGAESELPGLWATVKTAWRRKRGRGSGVVEMGKGADEIALL